MLKAKLEKRLQQIEQKLQVNKKEFWVLNPNTCKKDNEKCEEEIAQIRKKHPNAEIRILKAQWR